MGEKKITRSTALWDYIIIEPNWAFLAHVRPAIIKEVKEWDDFAAKEEFDLKEYARLKEKFEK